MPDHAYLRIADELRRRIASGELAPGARFPSQAEIVATYQVSDATAWRARDVLMREGLLDARSGAGTYVREQPIHRRIARGYYHRTGGSGSPFRATEAARGKRGDWSADTETADGMPENIAVRLGVDAAARVTRTTYTYRSDGVPVQLATSWEPYAITGGTSIIWPETGPHAGKGVVDRMAVIDVTITSVMEEVYARPATADEAVRLDVPTGAIVLVIERTYYADETPVETADIVLPENTRLVYEMPVS